VKKTLGTKLAKEVLEAEPLIRMVREEDVPHRQLSNVANQIKMKKVTQVSPTTMGSLVGKFLTPALTLAAAVAVLPSYQATADEFDLTTASQVTVTGDVGGDAIFRNNWEQPTGTGVFDPFLTLDSNGQTSTGNTSIESAYNTDGTRAIYLDQQKPNAFNKTVRFGDLQNIGGYYVFDLDANEPGGGKSLISIDNIRIYTSAGDKTLAGIGTANLDDLGTLRWAMNTPLSTGTTPPDLNGFNVTKWVKLDSNQNNNDSSKANGGSGQADMWVLIPVTAFGDAAADDYVWFYNLNGVHYTADGDLAAQAGFEEWRSLNGPNAVPDGGNTLMLLGSALTALAFVAGRRKLATNNA
jgi:hypothetical protein